MREAKIFLLSLFSFIVTVYASSARLLDREDCLRRVDRRRSGDVIIQRIPAIEAQRNYCVPASVEMIMRYFGAKIKQRELGKIFNSSKKSGTSFAIDSNFGHGELRDFQCKDLYNITNEEYQQMINAYANSPKLSNTAKKRFLERIRKGEESAFDLIEKRYIQEELVTVRAKTADALKKALKEYVDKGIPLLWSVSMYFDPSDRVKGFHARIIAGYEIENGQISELIYLDPWTGRRKFKRMDWNDAVAQTCGFKAIFPLWE